MSGDYYELLDDLYIESRWYLRRLVDNAGTELDARDFTYGIPVDLGPPLRVSAWDDETMIEVQEPLTVLLDRKRPGSPIDFTFTNDNMPVVNSKVAKILALANADIQRVPVRVESRDDDYEIINVISRVDCIDTKYSVIQWFQPGNSVRPDLVGQPEMITKLVIDPMVAAGHHILRPTGWEVALIVSDQVKNALEAANVSGVRYRQVSL
jgi:hypothetical protein